MLPSPSPSALILGCGYVAKALMSMHSTRLNVTSREGVTGGSGTLIQPKYFNLDDPESWAVVGPFEHIVWTFPAAQREIDVENALRFFESQHLSNKKVLVLASTSAYQANEIGGLVDEMCTLDLLQHRVRAEEELRIRGACVLQLAGIYGPDRDPLSWLQKGLIKSPDSFINLIHISDICAIVMKWLSTDGFCGRRFNASDGRHRTWFQLIEDLKKARLLDCSFELSPNPSSSQRVSSKRICNEALVKELYSGPFHCYPEHGIERSIEN